jgi:ATP-dependent helicase/DNAse subunit B
MGDKYSAVWVSHSSISDFLACPRAYFLKNVYKSDKSGHKMTLMSPPLALGQIVHEVLEGLSVLPVAVRFKVSFLEKYEKAWEKVHGKLGGFFDEGTEKKYYDRGKEMLTRVTKNPGPIAELAVKIKEDLPHFWLSEEDNIILCGKIDWLKYLESNDTVEIIDFKTSKNEEGKDSLQLPIYHLLASYCQTRKVTKAAYWYLNMSDDLSPKDLPDLDVSKKKILKIALQIKLARSLKKMDCPEGVSGCRNCKPYEAILRGEAEFVAVDNMRRDIYVLPKKEEGKLRDDSVIL